MSYPVPCTRCEPGYSLVHYATEGFCKICPAFSGYINDDEECGFCKAGSYFERGLYLRNFMDLQGDGYLDLDSYCVTEESYAKDAYCLDSNGFLAVYGVGLQAGKRESAMKKFFLTTTFSIEEEGKITLNRDERIEIQFETTGFGYLNKNQLLFYIDGKLERKFELA